MTGKKKGCKEAKEKALESEELMQHAIGYVAYARRLHGLGVIDAKHRDEIITSARRLQGDMQAIHDACMERWKDLKCKPKDAMVKARHR